MIYIALLGMSSKFIQDKEKWEGPDEMAGRWRMT
jgi:hypothetical protein